MKVEGMHLAWVVVSKIDEAIKFYTEVVGLTLHEWHKEYGWAELSGPNGARLGLAQYNPKDEFKAGGNAVVTITVDDIELARQKFQQKNARLIGEVIEVPGHVKLQTFCDADGNTFQLCQQLD